MEKPLKVFWNGKLLRKIYPHATPFQVFKYKAKRVARKLVIGTIVISTVYGIYTLGSIMNPSVIYNQIEVIKEVETIPLIMKRIAGCESQGNAKLTGKHFDKNGQVLMRSNKNKSVDLGKYQINTVWFAKATELGYDLTLEKDNEEMAMWIYRNKGTKDWYSSESCWKN